MNPTYRLIAKHKASFHESLHVLTFDHQNGPGIGPDPLVLTVSEKVSEMVEVGQEVTFENIGGELPEVKPPTRKPAGRK